MIDLQGDVADNPGHPFDLASGTGGLPRIDLFSDGHAESRTGVAFPSGPFPDEDSANGIHFVRESIMLSPAGGTALITLHLPIGFGYRLGF